jgi:glycerophosphoryl diester phosphodiesterase
MRTIWLSLLFSTVLAAAPGHALAGETRARQILDRFEHANQWRDHVMVAAHRAGSMQAGKTLYAENSIAALEGSIAMGAEIVEVDIRRSKDGEFIVMHEQLARPHHDLQGRGGQIHAGRAEDLQAGGRGHRRRHQ